MKNKNIILSFILAIVLLLTGATPIQGNVFITQAAAKNKKIVLNVGQQKQLEVFTTDNVTWKSKNARIVTVDQDGMLTAKKAGSTLITAQYGKIKKNFNIRVESPKISAKKLTLKPGESKQLTVKGSTQNITWKSSKSTVVKVSSEGEVTALKKGNAVIKAKVGNKMLTCNVKVKLQK